MSDENFHERSEHELSALSDEQLLAYIKRARDTGRTATMTQAVRVLVWGYLRLVEYRVALKVPRHEADEVVGEIIESALKSAFDGVSKGEFHNWIHTIADRRIADHFRRNRLETTTLPDGSDDAGGRDIPQAADEGTVDVQRAIDAAVADLSETHRQIVDLYVFADLPAGEVAARTGETEANVHQVASRFRKRMRELLAEDEGDTGPRP